MDDSTHNGDSGGTMPTSSTATRRRRKPYLSNVKELGRAFRKYYLLGLRRLLRQGKLKIGGSVAFLNNPLHRNAFLEQLAAIDWNVFSQGPPHGKSDPQQVVKYYFGDRQRLAEVEALVIEENVVNFVLSKAKVKESLVSFDELMGNTQQS